MVIIFLLRPHYILFLVKKILTLVVCVRVLSEARALGGVPALEGAARLRTLRVDRARLTHLPHDLCRHAPQLRTLYVSPVPNYLPLSPKCCTVQLIIIYYYFNYKSKMLRTQHIHIFF